LRVAMNSPATRAEVIIVDYVVTNGAGAQATGQLAVTQQPAVDNDVVSVTDDYADVRVGDVTSVPVLANDFSMSGAELVLSDNTPGYPPGQLLVEDPSAPLEEATNNVGQAYVDGTHIRYLAPTSGNEPRQVRITYQASVAMGSPSTGHVYLTIVPEPVESAPGGPLAGNQPPVPSPIDVRSMAGETTPVAVNPYGQDPDGDSITVTGLALPPRFGRVAGITATGLTYESYPGLTHPGTDTLSYIVQDRYGGVGIGTVRIGLSPPMTPPPPLAVADVVTAQPGAAVTVYPKANDILPVGVSPADASVVIDGDVPGVTLDPATDTVATTAPAADDPAVTAGYHLDAGGVAGVGAQISVRSQVGYRNPPRIADHVADKVKDGVASVDVLDNAWDVDGPADAIHIVSVGTGATFESGMVSVPVADRGQIVPFVVEDADQSQAMAVVFVPGTNAARPGLVANGLVKMEQNAAVTVSLDDYIKSPRDRPVFLTQASQVWTSPQTGLGFTVASDNQVTLTALNDYTGPAALTVEVRDAAAADDGAALTAVVTIPVQIGPNQPVLHCPGDVVEVVAGGSARELDITRLCHVWTPVPGQLAYDATWASGGAELVLAGAGGSLPSPVVSVQAGPQAVAGEQSVMTIAVAGFPDATGQVPVVVIAGKPVLQVSSVTDVRQGATVTVPVTVTSQMRDAVQNIVSVVQASGPAAEVAFDDQAIRITPDATSHGVLAFGVVGSDVADDTRTDRQVTSSFTVTVYGVPDAPGAPQPGMSVRSRSAVVTFAPGADNGSPITKYEVRWSGGSQSCGLNTTCEITGLNNGTAYAFQVRATNKAGDSAWSDAGPPVIPDAVPGVVTGFAAGTPVCGGVTLSWTGVSGDGTAPVSYRISWAGKTAEVPGGNTRSYAAGGLDDNTVYTFSIVAVNQAGPGQQAATVKAQSSCKPQWPSGAAVAVAPQDKGESAAVTVSWKAADPRGPKPVTYHVTRSGGSAPKSFAATTNVSVDDSVAYDGTKYMYSVTAENATGGQEHTSVVLSTTWKAVGSPAAWSTVGGASALSVTATGTDGQLEVSVLKWPAARDAAGSLYVVVKNGTTKVAQLDPATSSRKVDGFEDGKDVELTFTAYNSSPDGNVPQKVQLKDGSYGPLGAPILKAVDGRGTKACVEASTPTSGDRKDTNGRPASLYMGALGGPTCDDQSCNSARQLFPSKTPETNGPITSTWCEDTGDYNKTITFLAYLKTTTGLNRTDSESVSVRATSPYGTPDALNAAKVSCVATGTDGQATCSVSEFPAANAGPNEQATIKITGLPGPDITATGGQWSKTIDGFTNGVETPVIFTPCNTKQCNTAGAVTVKVTTYGPMSLVWGEVHWAYLLCKFHIYGPSCGGGITSGSWDKRVCVSANVNGNGGLVSVSVTSDHGGSETKSGSDQFTADLCVDAGGPNVEVKFTATLKDKSGHGRADQSLPRSETSSPDPPAPTVDVTRDRADKKPCATNPSQACYPVLFSTSNFQGDPTCTFKMTSVNTFSFTEPNGFYSTKESGLGDTVIYYGAGDWIVTCKDPAGHQATQSGKWDPEPYP